MIKVEGKLNTTNKSASTLEHNNFVSVLHQISPTCLYRCSQPYPCTYTSLEGKKVRVIGLSKLFRRLLEELEGLGVSGYASEEILEVRDCWG